MKFQQSSEVEAVLREHVGRHFAGQHKILMITEGGALLIMRRGYGWDEERQQPTGIYCTSVQRVSPDQDWKPALQAAGYMRRKRVAA